MTADIVTDALIMACFRKGPAAGVKHLSGCYSQSASRALQSKLKEHDMICSLSHKRNCWDNASTESWLNSFKNERGHESRYTTLKKMTAVSLKHIKALYSRKWQHSTPGYKSLMQFLNGWLLKGKLVA